MVARGPGAVPAGVPRGVRAGVVASDGGWAGVSVAVWASAWARGASALVSAGAEGVAVEGVVAGSARGAAGTPGASASSANPGRPSRSRRSRRPSWSCRRRPPPRCRPVPSRPRRTRRPRPPRPVPPRAAEGRSPGPEPGRRRFGSVRVDARRDHAAFRSPPRRSREGIAPIGGSPRPGVWRAGGRVPRPACGTEPGKNFAPPLNTTGARVRTQCRGRRSRALRHP